MCEGEAPVSLAVLRDLAIRSLRQGRDVLQDLAAVLVGSPNVPARVAAVIVHGSLLAGAIKHPGCLTMARWARPSWHGAKNTSAGGVPTLPRTPTRLARAIERLEGAGFAHGDSERGREHTRGGGCDRE